MNATEEQIPYTHELVVDADYQRTLVRAVFGTVFRRPWFWVGVSLLGLICALQLGAKAAGVVPVLITGIVAIGILLGLYYLQLKRVLLRAVRRGAVMRTGFGSTHFVITNGNDTSRMAYSGFGRAERRGQLVWVRRLDVPRRLVFAGALFSDSELALLGGVGAPSSADSPRPTPGTPV